MDLTKLLLHPVRLQVVHAFLPGRRLTTTQLRSELRDVPVATLYRHVARLVDGGVLQVVSERQVRGAIERTYALGEARTSIDREQAATLSVEDHRRGFAAFVAALLASFERYLDAPGADPANDGVGYRQVACWLSDAELDELGRDLAATLAPYLALGEAPGRRRRTLATVLVPDPGS